MKSLFLFTATVLATIIVLSSTTAVDATAKLQRPPRALFPLRRLSSPTGCVDNISAALHDIIDAGEAIVHAAFACPNKNQTAECIEYISAISTDLIAAGKRIDEAVTACGGHGSVCVQDLLAAGQAITDAAERIAKAVAQCEHKEILQCVQDVTETALDVEDLVRDIRQAAMVCGKTQPPRKL